MLYSILNHQLSHFAQTKNRRFQFYSETACFIPALKVCLIHLFQCERSSHSFSRVWTNPQIKISRFGFPLFRGSVKFKIFCSYLKRYHFRLFWLQLNFLKTFQFFHRARNTSNQIANIQLNDLFSGNITGIGYCRFNYNFSAFG